MFIFGLTLRNFSSSKGSNAQYYCNCKGLEIFTILKSLGLHYFTGFNIPVS